MEELEIDGEILILTMWQKEVMVEFLETGIVDTNKIPKAYGSGKSYLFNLIQRYIENEKYENMFGKIKLGDLV